MTHKQFLIQDGAGYMYNKVIEPTVVFDIEMGVLLKIGEHSDMVDYYKETCKAYLDLGFVSVAKDIVLMVLPKDQTIIDKVFQNTGFLKRLYQDSVRDS